ncbi:MAG: hypothetical protein IJE19_09335 [Clostridia bacterium]|nr:hypothetical protein [Clostridia bacterium]
MKKNIKRSLSYVLASLVFMNSAAAFAASAEEIPEIPQFGFIETEKSDNTGYISDRYVDESGSEIVFEEPEELPLYCCSADSLSVPTSFDSREEGLVTVAKDQGSTNNCWIFSTISVLESDSIAKNITNIENTDFSEAHLSWFASRVATNNESDTTYGDGQNIESPYLKGGNWRIVTAALARRSGLANENDFPFFSDNISAMGNYSEAERYNHDSGAILESAQELTDVNEIKEWITEHGSISAAYYHSSKMYNSENYSYYGNLDNASNHQITVIGWNDEYPAENFSKSGSIPAGDGAWLCQNSWGTDWGDNGCFWISYYDCTLSDFYGFTARSTKEYYKNYSYNGAEYNTFLIDENLSGAANVFKSGGNENLSSVSFYTLSSDVFIRINIYKNLPEGYTNPSQGELAATLEQTFDHKGFHTLYLDSPLSLEPGEIFSVTVNYSHPSGEVYIPIERNSSSRTYHGNKYETFILNIPGTNSWYPSSLHGFQNAYIQVTTECEHCCESHVSSESTCIKNGTAAEICTICGKTVNESFLPLEAHEYGEWSEYHHDNKSGKEVSTRKCIVCGTVQTQSYFSGNTITLYDLIMKIFGSMFEIFKNFR